MKKGFTFSLEAVIAVMMLLTFIVVISSMSFIISQEVSYERLHHLSRDVSELMRKTRIRDARNLSPIKEYLEEGIITQEDLNKTILDVIGSFWAKGNISYARNITESILNKTLKENFGYEILMNGDTISSSSLPQRNFLSRSSVVVSGYSVGRPVEGYSAKASLEKIKGKTTSSFVYFGGFVGQGNITAIMREIPADANVTSIKIEANFGDNFTLYVNGNFCKDFVKTPGDFSVDSWIIEDPACLSSIKKGEDNVFNINFTGSDLTKKYIGGGFVKVEYSTSQMSEQISNSTRYFFPGIEGFINHYDSFYVPGNITSMSIYLHFLSNHSTFLNIGNITVFNFTGSEAVQTITIDNDTLSSLLNYDKISLITVPLRFGIEAFTQLGNADVILVTDLSGSMNWDMTSENTGVERSCDDPKLYDNDTKRLSLAKCLDKEFVDIILSTPGNRVGLSAFYGDTSPPYKGRVTYHDLSDNRTSLINEIDSYWARGGTCICCSINNAYNILNTQSNASRMKYVVVMSDGIPTHQCGTRGVDECRGTRDGTRGNEGLWLGWGAGCFGGLEDCEGTDCLCAMENANWSSCRVHENLNSTVYSIGFGPVSECTNANWTLQAIANCGGGAYYFSGNASQLEEIYRTIAQTIANASLIRQAVNVTETNTTLYPDSFISFNFTPVIPQYGYGEISIKVETNPFENCSGSFFVPQQFTVDEIGVTSYSADYWTNNLYINNSATDGWKNVFNLTSYSSDYTRLGDPYIIKFPASYARSGETNYVNMTLGASPTNISSNCSSKNRAIYTARLIAYTSYSGVFSKVQGKNVTVYFDRDHDGTADGFTYVAVGENLPNFNATPVTVDELNITDDALDFALLELLEKLNFVIMPFNSGRPGSSTNPIDLEITSEIKIESFYVPGIYTLWGPAILEVRIWA
ncbi:MAG: vWA domain-containing protein [Candidatus Aenigmarchaeota archaeon]|nr:vWA domain-containing protein [Candidatus Aenigmarchaeota archaeon]